MKEKTKRATPDEAIDFLQKMADRERRDGELSIAYCFDLDDKNRIIHGEARMTFRGFFKQVRLSHSYGGEIDVRNLIDFFYLLKANVVPSL
ncbi:hypothetical protein [Prochlorothrix hollandica]|uniref:hypothetical protein n=1 Tax=Prochlorothrix hollandica TaxID=1223 RepID=UPI00333F345B